MVSSYLEVPVAPRSHFLFGLLIGGKGHPELLYRTVVAVSRYDGC